VVGKDSPTPPPPPRWGAIVEAGQTRQRVRARVLLKARIGCHDEGVVTCVALTP